MNQRPAPFNSSDSPPILESIQLRAPEVIHNVIQWMPDLSADAVSQLQQLANEMATNAPIRLPPDTGMPGYQDWYTVTMQHVGETWLNTVWFFAEVLFYRQIVEYVDFYNTRRDPFRVRKDEELASPALKTRLESALESRQIADPIGRLQATLSHALWGNRMDLSYALSVAHGTTVSADDLIVDHSHAALTALLGAPPTAPIHIVHDNFGSEHACDLVLIDALLELLPNPIICHLKAHPTFVSDTLPEDDQRFKELLRKGQYGDQGVALSQRLDAQAHRVTYTADWVWNSPYFGWDFPEDVLNQFKGAALVIFKGDLNYRRMIGDAPWPPETPFHQVLDYFPAPALALRVLKSDAICGLPDGIAEQLDQVDPNWRFNGKRGVIQFRQYSP
jgi:uncharacterized protein with ATP-grasp and redox domains